MTKNRADIQAKLNKKTSKKTGLVLILSQERIRNEKAFPSNFLNFSKAIRIAHRWFFMTPNAIIGNTKSVKTFCMKVT